MPINNPRQAGYIVRPRLRVVSDGVEIPNAASAMINSNNHFQADRFALLFVPTLSGIGSFSWWSKQTTVKVDIQAGFTPPGADPTSDVSWKSLLVGEADKMTMEPGKFIVDIEGRDLTAKFIDAQISGSYVNQSSKEIVKKFADSHGLKSQISDKPGLVGRFWASDHETSSLNQSSGTTTEWDMIVKLAKKDGYDAFMQGDTLYFQPETLETADPYVWLYEVDNLGRQTGNVNNLKMDRVLTVAKGLHVTVQSWHAKRARGFEKTSSSAASIGGDGKSEAQQYKIQHPNMTEDEAQEYADVLAREFARHERLIQADMPGDLLLTPRVMVRLQGTGTDFDQVYYPTSIIRELTVQSGFTMRAACKNRSTAAT